MLSSDLCVTQLVLLDLLLRILSQIVWIFLLPCPSSALTYLISKPIPSSAKSPPETQLPSISPSIYSPADSLIYSPVSTKRFHIQISIIIMLRLLTPICVQAHLKIAPAGICCSDFGLDPPADIYTFRCTINLLKLSERLMGIFESL